MAYSSRIREWRFSSKSRRFNLDKWIPRKPKGRSISFSFAIKYTVDPPGLPPSTFTGGLYKHKPLIPSRQQIRLLSILPGKPNEAIQTTLITVDLENAPPYEALSYVWGSSPERSSLSIDGLCYTVNKGAFDAIHTLRLPDRQRLVWCDTFCIYQNNVEERSSQVAIMGKIYHQAQSVTVYLGKHTEKTGDAMEALRYFMGHKDATKEPPWSHTPITTMERNIMDIIGRPWFTRIWTVQEATLARHTTLVCGGHEISWSGDSTTLRSIIFRLKDTAISPQYATARDGTLDWSPLLLILETQLRQAARREGIALHRNQLDLAYDFRHRRCTDPRDKYFAIMNIIENDRGADLQLAPDYNVTLEQLHLKFMKEVQRIAEIEDKKMGGEIQIEKWRQAYTDDDTLKSLIEE